MAGSPRTSESSQAAFSQAVRLMVIEDDEDTLANLCDILELDGYDVTAARSLQEAMSRADWSDLDAIVLDRRLPDGTADAVLPKLKQMAPQAPVIVITGYADLDGAIRALRLAAADYLIKPVDASDLRQSVRRLVGQAATERQLREEREFAARIFETAQAIILVLDTDGRIVRFNPFMEEVSGYRLEEVRGRDWFQTFLPEADWERIRKVFQ
ncbi:MAG: response regulator, partial [Planctomycetota bacterium]